MRRADEAGLVGRCCGICVAVAATAVPMPAVRPCLLSRPAAATDQRLAALHLLGSELAPHASVHGAAVAERQMLVQALDLLGPGDVLLLDRGYPAAKDFLHSSANESVVTFNAPSSTQVRYWQCSPAAPWARLVRETSPNGLLRVLVTNLLDVQQFRRALCVDLYHQRWRIEDAFKRIKLRLKIEAVSGFTQLSLVIDVAAKMLADNITSLLCAAAHDAATFAARCRNCNRSYAAGYMQRVLPCLTLVLGDLLTTRGDAVAALSANHQRFRLGRSQPRPNRHVTNLACHLLTARGR